jgi:membrane protein
VTKERRGAGRSEETTIESPKDLPKPLWRNVFIGAIREFRNDNLVDAAAALTYYAILSIFPGLLLLASLVGMSGRNTTAELIDNLNTVIPESAQDILKSAIEESQRGYGTAGTTAVLGLVGALWSASAFVGAFMRTSNTVFDVPERRPMWKVVPIRLALTVVLLALMATSSLIVVLTGDVARWIGRLLHLTSATVATWNIVKWPVLAVLVMLMLAILYWASPNVRHPGFRWVTPGGAVAIALWLAGSAGFALYVANFASYNRTYGTVTGVIVFLVWIWVSNLAVLFGAEFDAELDRARAHAQGLPPGQEPYVELRES